MAKKRKNKKKKNVIRNFVVKYMFEFNKSCVEPNKKKYQKKRKHKGRGHEDE